jgi:hypothetical protein
MKAACSASRNSSQKAYVALREYLQCIVMRRYILKTVAASSWRLLCYVPDDQHLKHISFAVKMPDYSFIGIIGLSEVYELPFTLSLSLLHITLIYFLKSHGRQWMFVEFALLSKGSSDDVMFSSVEK